MVLSTFVLGLYQYHRRYRRAQEAATGQTTSVSGLEDNRPLHHRFDRQIADAPTFGEQKYTSSYNLRNTINSQVRTI